jgi:single-strand DNA-binding protein
MDFAKIILIGRIVKKPALRKFHEKTLANITLARNPYGSQEAEYYNFVAYGKNAEFAEQYLDKGKPALFEGEPRIKKWEGKDGAKHTEIEIRVTSITLLPDGKTPSAKSGQEDHDNFLPEDDDFPL